MKKNLRFLLALAISWLSGLGAFALDQVDGVYQIGTADQLIEFAGIVNGGENGANAVLTADIDMTDKAWTPIGDDAHRYIGTFDGQYHKIDNLKATGESKFGIFGVVNGGCVIKNLIAGPGNEIKGTSMIGGIIGASDGSGWVTLENVGHEGYVEGTGNNCCAFFGVVMNGGPATRMTNCYNTGNIKAGGESAIITGWFGGHGSVEVKGFWNTGEILAGGDDENKALWRNNAGITKNRIFNINNNNGATVITSDDLTSGKLAFMLNDNADAGVWHQNLGDSKDSYPTFDPSHGAVYANGNLMCDGITPKEGSELTFSNTEGATVDEHAFVDGLCTVCHNLQDVDGFYQIGSADALNRFSEIVRTTNGAAKAVLTKDIDYTAYKQGFIGVSQDSPFRGIFDGQGHTITIDIVNNGSGRTGLFAYINAATIKNLVVEGSATSAGNNCVGGLGGRSDGNGTLIENVVVKTAVSYTGSNGDATCGGFFANMESSATLQNCAFYGSISTGTAEGNGGFIGWAGGGSNIKLVNCIVAPSAYTKNGNSADYARNNPSTTDCIVLTGDDARLATGEMTYILNGNQSENVKWYQKLGEEGDAYPMPFGTDIVYANGQLDCAGNAKEGTTVTYSNTDGAVRDEHQFAEGFCTACGTVDVNYIAATDGVYNLASAKDVVWFAALVNSGKGNANANLTVDIDFTDVTFTGIGNASNHYTGTFDGKGHIVKNMVINLPEKQGVGFFNEIDNGAVIKNFTIDASCSVKGKAFTGAFVGHVSGSGTALLERLGNEGAVETVNQNAGAIVGCNTSGELKLTIKNCYNAGAIKSGNEAGGLSGWFGNDAITINCYNMGTVTNGESYARGNNIQITNCFDAVTSLPALNKVDAADFTNGVVYALLAEAAPYVWFLSAEEGGHPVLYKTKWGGKELSPYAGVEVQEGEEFYLYNVESGMWLQENNRFTADWNTHGELGTVGFDVKLIKSGDGWQIDPKFGHNNSMNGNGQYLDTNESVTAWTFVPVDIDGISKTYYIKSGDNYLRAGDNDKLTCNGTAEKNIWQVVTREQRIEYAKTATKASPKDLSFLIRGNEFTHEDTRRQANWTLSDNDNSGEGWNAGRFDGDNRQNSVFEAWEMTKMNLAQTVTGLPAGFYTVEVRASESPTGNGGVTRELLNQYNAGTLEQYGVLYANDVTVKLPSIYSEQYSERTGHFAARNLDGIWMIDGVNQFCYAVANKETAYKVVTEPVEIAENGSINLGVLVKDAPNKSVWVMIDKFRLNYLGTTLEATVEEYIPVLNEAIKKAEEFDATTTTTALATALATAIENGKAARSATTVAEVETAIAEINTALENAQAVNIIILKKTVALAQAEGIDVEAANSAVAEATTADAINNELNALRLARRMKAAETHENVFRGSKPAEGDFYLFNVAAKRFLCGGDDWGAHAAVGFPGQIITLTGTDGNYRLNTHLPNGGGSEYLGYNGYMDTNSSDTWNVLPVGETGAYVVARSGSNENLLGYDKNTYNVVHSDRHDSTLPENQWILVSVAERDSLLELASDENPVDVSYKIQTPGFDQRAAIDKWAMNNFSIWGRGGNHPDFACESWDKETNKLSQTIEGLKSGNYKVSIQGYFRDGNLTNQVNLIAADNEPAQLVTFYAGDKTALMPNIVSDRDMAPGLGTSTAIGEVPDNCDQACSYFQLGLYKTEVEVTVGEDGKLEIGVYKNSKNFDQDWVVVDNFRLTYYGDPAKAAFEAAKDALTVAIEKAKAAKTDNKTAESVAALTQAISDAELALAAADATVESLTTAKTAVETALAGLEFAPLVLPEGTIYAWLEGQEGGGKAEASDAQSVAFANANFVTIRLNGAKDFSTNVITITLDKELNAGDTIKVTAYRNKDVTNKKSGFKAKFDKGGEVSTSTGMEFININEAVKDTEEYATEPNTCEFYVPESAAGSKVMTITRAETATNLFITALAITKYVNTTGINTIAADRLNGEIYNLNGQKMLKAQKGLYIINGKKAVVK